jgi:hypothetical protein
MATGNSRQRPFRVRKSYVLTDAEQREFLSRQCEALAREQPGIKTVRDRLLAIGGAETCLVGREEERDQMLTRGRAYSGRRAIRRTGERSRCHANVAGLHEQDPAGCRIATGYALSDDGIWRRHSWGLGPDERPIETTTPSVAYFGFDLTADEADAFCDLQW